MRQRTVFIARLTIIALATAMMTTSVFAQQDAEKKPEEPKPAAEQQEKKPEAPKPAPQEQEKKPEQPKPAAEQQEKKPETPKPAPQEQEKKPEQPKPAAKEQAKKPEAPPKWKTHLEKKHEAFFAWLEKNYPNKANELKDVGNNRPGEFGKRISEIIETYEPIQKADQKNPELAKVLREDLKLQQQRDDILRKLRNAKSKEEQDKLLGELHAVVAARFDSIIQKKQIEYDITRKRLEWINKRLQQHGEELQKLKDEKGQNVEKRMKELTDGKIKMDWK